MSAHPVGPRPPSEAALRAALAPLERRTFLRLTGAALVGTVLPGCGPPPARLAPPPHLVLRTLTTRTYATFQAAGLRLIGPPGAALVEAGRVDPAAAADAWLGRVPELAPRLIQGLALLEFGIWPLLPKLRPFTRLEAADQDAVLVDLRDARLDAKRDLFRGLRSLALLVFYAHPASRQVTGYPGPFDAEGIAAAMAFAED